MTPALRWAAMRAILMFHNCDGQSHKTVSTDHNFWRERRTEADLNWCPSAYQPTALPLGQAGSQRTAQTAWTDLSMYRPRQLSRMMCPFGHVATGIDDDWQKQCRLSSSGLNPIFYFISVHVEVILDQKQKQIIIIYANFPTGLWTIDLTILVITSVLYEISLTLL